MSLFSNVCMGIACTVSLTLCCGWDEFPLSSRLLTSKLLSDQKWEPFLPEVPRYASISNEQVAPPSLEKGIAQEWHNYKPSISADAWYLFLFKNGNTPLLTKEEKDYLSFMKTIESLVDVAWDWDYEGISTARADSMGLYAQSALRTANQATIPAFLKQRYIFQALRLYHYAGQYDSAIALSASTGWENGEKNLTYWRMKALKAGALRKLKQGGTAMALFAEVAQNSPELLYMAYQNCKFIEDWEAGLAAAHDPGSRAMLLFTKLVYQDRTDPETLGELAKIEAGSSRFEVAFLKQVDAYDRMFWRPALQAGQTMQWTDSTIAGAELLPRMVEGNLYPLAEKPFWQRLWDAIIRLFHRIFGEDPQSAGAASTATGLPPAFAILQCGLPKPDTENTFGVAEKDSLEHGTALIKLAVSLGESPALANRAIYYLGAAQLALMTGELDAVPKYAEKATALANHNATTASSAALFTALAVLQQQGVTSTPFETAAAAFLASTPDSNSRNLFFAQTGGAYLREHQYGNAAAAFLSRLDNRVSGKLLLDVLITLPELDSLQTKRQSPRSPYFAALYAALPDDNGFAELAGNKLMRAGKFQEAVERFERCGNAYWEQKYKIQPSQPGARGLGRNDRLDFLEQQNRETGPVMTSLDVTPDQGRMAVTAMGRLEFARQARDLSGRQAYASLLRLGNLFYHDWSWHYSDRLWEGYGLLDAIRIFEYQTSELFVSPEISQDLFNRAQLFIANYSAQQMAAHFYAQAYNVAQTDEQKGVALFAFTAAKSQNWTSAQSAALAAFDKHALYTLLQEKTQASPILAELAGRCSELQDFLAGNGAKR